MSKIGQNMEQFRDKPDDELRAELATTRDALFRLQLGQYTNQVTSTAEIQTKRRDIARIMTILRARELGNEKQAQKAATSSEASATDAAPAKKTRKAKAK